MDILVYADCLVVAILHSQGIQYGTSLGSWGRKAGAIVNAHNRQANREAGKAAKTNGAQGSWKFMSHILSILNSDTWSHFPESRLSIIGEVIVPRKRFSK